jgi:isocitrate dehydrogenase
VAASAGPSKCVGTFAFAEEVVARLGQEPQSLKPVRYAADGSGFTVPEASLPPPASKALVGVDVFVHWAGENPEALAARMKEVQDGALELTMITSRGVKVWPHGIPETTLTDHWRCRYTARTGKQLTKRMIAELQLRLAQEGIDFIKTEHLCTFDGTAGFSLGQGQ